MARHKKLWTMAVEGIDEYLMASRICLHCCRKPDGGCLGYPSTLLLFCVVNALGIFLAGETVVIEERAQKITPREPFRVLNHAYFGLSLSHKEIKLLEHSYRNALAHNAIIEPGASMLPSTEEPPFIFGTNRIEIRAFSFYSCVAQAWERFPRKLIQKWEKQRRISKQPTTHLR